MKVIVEDIIEVLSKRYRDRINEESPVGVLMCGLEDVNGGNAKMYYIHGVGYGEETNFLCTGHGGTYATSIAKFLCNSRLSVEENARLIAYVISWISEDVDTTVGGSPQVIMLRNDQDFQYLDDELIEKAGKHAQESKSNLKNILNLESILNE